MLKTALPFFPPVLIQTLLTTILVWGLFTVLALRLPTDHSNAKARWGIGLPTGSVMSPLVKALGAWLMLSLLGLLVLPVETAAPTTTTIAAASASQQSLWVYVAIGVLSPLGEEAFYRGVLWGGCVQGWQSLRQHAVKHLPVPLSTTLAAGLLIGLTTLAFALGHGGWALLATPTGLVIVGYGLILGWLRHRAQSVWPGIVLHCLHNSVVLVSQMTK